ncbi:MAG: peptidase M13, partial [Brevundimonas sp.]
MKSLLIGGALAALLLPAAASAQTLSGDHDHSCINATCTQVSIMDAFAESGEGGHWTGVEAPRFGTWGFDLAGRDLSVKPGDDFFRYANGRAFDALTIPSDRTNYGSFAVLRELSDNRLKAMVDQLTTRGDLRANTDEQRIADLYRSYADQARVDQLDAQPLQPLLAAIRAADTHEKMAAFMGGSQQRFGASVFGAFISDDAKNPSRYITYLNQSGIGLPTRDYYLDARFADKKEAYQAYAAQMLEMIGWADPTQAAAAIVAMETRIAEAQWTPAENRDDSKTYHAFTPAELAAAAPGLDWNAYLGAAGLGSVETLVVRQDTAFPKIAAIYAETPVETLQAWQAFRTASEAAPYLSQRFSDAQWQFYSHELSGQPEQRPRDKRAVSFAEGAVGEAFGRLYVADYFPAASKAKMEELVANLRTALAGRIRNLDWMSEETKQQALYKLEHFNVKIGYPTKWRD